MNPAKRKPRYPVFVDGMESPAWAAFKVKLLPPVYLIDHQNQVVQQWQDNVDYAIIEGAIEGLIGRPD